jgi:2OG-Fe(II) oxygenase superfamily
MLDEVLFFDEPYRHFLCFDSFNASNATEMRDVLSSELDWGVREGSFYVTYRLDLRAFYENRPTPRFLRQDVLFALRDRVGEMFSVPLSDDVQVLGHRMIPGQQIGVHNDNPGLGFESYRIVTQFTQDHRPEDGGELNIHVSDSPDAIYQSIRPCPNMSFGFEMSGRSYHSVNEVRNRNRDAVIFNFWHVGNTPQVERAIRRAVDEAAEQMAASGQQTESHDSGLSAAVVARRLMANWGMTERMGAAAALHALQTAPQKDDGNARVALARPWRETLGLGSEIAGLEFSDAAELACESAPLDAQSVRATLALAVWVARAPRRMFTPLCWAAARELVLAAGGRLPAAAQVLAEQIFTTQADVSLTL